MSRCSVSVSAVSVMVAALRGRYIVELKLCSLQISPVEVVWF